MKLPTLESSIIYFKKLGKGIAYGIYNPKSKQIVFRTPFDFVLTCIFYIIFYSLFTCLFFGLYRIFYMISIGSTDYPQQLNLDILGHGPSLVPFTDTVRISTYETTKPETYKKHTDPIKEKIEAYGKLEYANLCSSNNKDNGLCKFDTSVFTECLQNDYGFQIGTPCLFFRLNQILGYVPQPVDKDQSFVKVSCKSADDDALKIFPAEGFLINALPFNGKNIPPAVAVKLSKKPTKSIIVECKIGDVEGMKSTPINGAHQQPGVIKFFIEPIK